MDEQIKILNDERLRLVEGVNAGILSSESVNQRMLEINKIIEDMIKNKDKNPFDKMFPGQSLTMNKGGEARSFPDLTGDGKVTQADILKGRGVKMANGGEIDMAIEDVSRGTMAMPAQEEMQPTQEEITMVQQVMETVMQMVAQGASEEEIVMVLQQMGLDQEDIAMVMQIVAQQMQEAPAPGAAIDAELSQMM
ncbi:hypothetical protein N9P69_01685 [Gammaproteobacteria bacterium]|jgi:hypothetical protein|nr:hypothetical protein [Gammaproteobacteria bacterium]